MQLISVLTALATFKVAGAAALPLSVIDSNNLATRTWIQGSKVCVDVNFGGYCQTIFWPVGSKPGLCVRLDDSIRGLVSSVQPLEKSECRYYVTENCQDPTNRGCALYDVSSGIPDLKTVVPTGALSGSKCEPAIMDKNIQSFYCYIPWYPLI